MKDVANQQPVDAFRGCIVILARIIGQQFQAVQCTDRVGTYDIGKGAAAVYPESPSLVIHKYSIAHFCCIVLQTLFIHLLLFP